MAGAAPGIQGTRGVLAERAGQGVTGINVKELESKARLFLTLAGHDFAAFLVGGQPG